MSNDKFQRETKYLYFQIGNINISKYELSHADSKNEIKKF